MQWKGQIDVQHVTEGRSTVAETQPHPCIGEDVMTGALPIHIAPGATNVYERSRSDMNETKRIPVGKAALL